MFKEIRSPEDVVDLVREIGFLPFFAGEIPGFSVEECCAPELWFSEEEDGPWEWKGPIVRSLKCVYGKFYSGKAMFISPDWFPDFANYRRRGRDFEELFEEGLISYKDRDIYEEIRSGDSIISKDLKRALGYRKGGNRGFDSAITRLQAQTFVCISDFVYMIDKHGAPYGWGVAEYSTPEFLFGEDFVTSAYGRDPLESRERIADRLREVLPLADDRQIDKLLK